MLPTFYISDCYDDNAKSRYAARIAAVTPQANCVNFIGVKTDIEAAGCVVDIIDGLEGAEAVIFVNVAPRGTHKTKWPNGTPFGYLQFNNSHIFATIDGHTLSLLKKINNNKLDIDVFDIPSVVSYLTQDKDLQERITKTQFRSFDFLPRVAGAVLSGKKIPTEKFNNISNAPNTVWWVDNFGNAKLTLLNTEMVLKPGKEVGIKLGSVSDAKISSPGKEIAAPPHPTSTPRGGAVFTLKYYGRLKDIPFGETALYSGSSGFGMHRFLEITTQKGEDLSSQHKQPSLNLKVGDMITLQDI